MRFPGFIGRYIKWLHTQWPAGIVEKLPQVNEDYSTNVPGLYIVGDLTGIPLLKFSSDSGAKAVQTIIADKEFQEQRSEEKDQEILDLVIVGAGVSGMAAALEAEKSGLNFEILEATEPFSTVVNFPKGKPIYTYPTDMTPAGDLQFTADVKEPLVDELKAETLDRGINPRLARVEQIERKGNYFDVVIPKDKNLPARRVIVGIGRSGNFRKLGVPGEDLDKVFNRLHDPKDFSEENVLVVGGGDSAIETAIAIAQCGGYVTLSYRKSEFSRPKPDNVDRLNKLISDPMADVGVETPVSERVTTSTGGFIPSDHGPGKINLMMKSQVKNITETEVALIDSEGKEVTIPNDAVFTMIGREAPLGFLRRNGVKIRGEISGMGWLGLILFLLFVTFVYHWKAGGSLSRLFESRGWFPHNVPKLINSLGQSVADKVADPSTFIGTISITLDEPGFYYSLVYTLLIIIFGITRIRRRKTPYIKVQTISLTLFQVIPLFLLPYFFLPYIGHNGLFDSGVLKSVADSLFPEVNYDHGREYWRAFGFILAWPLFIWNVFSYEPLWGWLIISIIQTFVIIPVIIYFWGKGAYCGWICSCGAMAETLGDTQRHKMPHGSKWNRVNLVGQVILAISIILLITRVISWTVPDTSIGQLFTRFYEGLLYNWKVFGFQLNYKWFVDLFLAGIIGYGLYFWFSGRLWCRFACPLAALMHIYAKFSRFRILADKKKCISCNVCTSVCHQGIDIMNFANKGLPMEDPECVRCSACVQSCPTGVLQFGQINRKTGEVLKVDSLQASPVLMREQ
ncbi:NAD(P)-binding domain-containing protein [Desulfobacterota bacterium AH_259_B03_O07]|nr:NAD(P)-binding domain-containing protein [Desulfobacterota bacterium AH_259_B03_O07]